MQTIEIDARGEKHFVAYDPGVFPVWRPTAEQAAAVATAKIITTVVFSQNLALFEAVLDLKRTGELYADFMDTADFSADFRKIEPFLARVDGAFFGLDSRRNGALIERIRAFAADSGKLCVVTLGDEGAIAFDGVVEQRVIAEFQPNVIDTTGAGDTFAGTLLALRSRGETLRACLDAASEAATRHVTVTR